MIIYYTTTPGPVEFGRLNRVDGAVFVDATGEEDEITFESVEVAYGWLDEMRAAIEAAAERDPEGAKPGAKRRMKTRR